MTVPCLPSQVESALQTDVPCQPALPASQPASSPAHQNLSCLAVEHSRKPNEQQQHAATMETGMLAARLAAWQPGSTLRASTVQYPPDRARQA